MNVPNYSCPSRRIKNVNIEKLVPEDLDNLLGKFSVDVKKQGGGDYEAEPLKIMQCALDRYLKDNGLLHLSIIHRPKSSEVWYTKVEMGQITIGNIMKSMASCLDTNTKSTNPYLRVEDLRACA